MITRNNEIKSDEIYNLVHEELFMNYDEVSVAYTCNNLHHVLATVDSNLSPCHESR